MMKLSKTDESNARFIDKHQLIDILVKECKSSVKFFKKLILLCSYAPILLVDCGMLRDVDYGSSVFKYLASRETCGSEVPGTGYVPGTWLVATHYKVSDRV